MRIAALLLALPLSVGAVTDKDIFDIQRAQRQVDAHAVKANVAHFDETATLPPQEWNGDQQRYEDFRGNFNKGLRHEMDGFPFRRAYLSLVKALTDWQVHSFNNIEIGQGVFRLVNPQASLAYSLAGNDGWLRAMPPAPKFNSGQTAGEMVELYWTALVRNVPFNEFDTDATVADAVADLNNLADFRGPKDNGMVTPGTFLRGNTPGDLIGPYISQFLYLDIPHGAKTIGPEIRVPEPSGNDFLTTFADWFQVVTGGPAAGSITYDTNPTFIRNPRDLGEYVHLDTPGQASIDALYILVSFGPNALDPALPYLNNATQDGFVTFGIAQFEALVRKAIEEGLKAAWFQKWQVHRRLRPEEFGFYVQEQVADSNPMGISPELINSAALPAIFAANSTYFLPLAYPEGSPVHPSYPAGHATLIGAAVTILKAIFNEDFVIPSPLEPNATNTALVASADTLTVGNELNKLAANISLGRDHAGVHYRSDGFDGMNLGEQIAIDLLNNESFLFNENFAGFTLTKFDGTPITVGQKRNT